MDYFLVQKCVLCMFYVDWELEVQKTLVRVELQETNIFFGILGLSRGGPHFKVLEHSNFLVGAVRQ